MEDKSLTLRLREQFCEEIEDAHEYLDLAEEAERDGWHLTARGFKMIAHEEMSHANFLRERLLEWGEYPDGKDDKWHHLLHRLGYE
jgi:rubrerythrin